MSCPRLGAFKGTDYFRLNGGLTLYAQGIQMTTQSQAAFDLLVQIMARINDKTLSKEQLQAEMTRLWLLSDPHQ